jgi:hypothetical protein
MARSSWEDRDYSHLENWDERHYSDSEPESDDDMADASDASQQLFDLLVQFKMKGELSAKAVCTIAHWAKLGGLTGKCTELAMAPSRTGGAFSALFDKVLGLDVAMKTEWYNVQVPTHCKYDASRSARPLAVKLAYEAIAEEIATTPDMFSRLQVAVDTGKLCPNYLDDPVVRDSPPGSVIPLGLYVDGVQYQKRDTTIGFWAINLITERRHLLACLPKRGLCRCGCRGYCSIYPILVFIEWSFSVMVAGLFPERRHDGPWPEDSPHQTIAGSELGFRAVPVIIKGDWAEFNTTLSFKSWTHHQHPCFKCLATGGPDGTYREHAGVSAEHQPWAPKTMVEYEQACSACEVAVVIPNIRVLRTLLGKLMYDKRKQGPQGRAIQADTPALGLLKHDRLEPTCEWPDVAAIDECTTFPMHLTFWRTSSETMCKHRCALFSHRSHLLPETLCVDELHTMHLGVFHEFNLAVFWQILDCDALQIRGSLAQDAYLESATMRMRAALFRWYSVQKRTNKEKPIHALQEFKLSMLGKSDARVMKGVKAAESGTLLAFCVQYAVKFRAVLPGGEALVACGESLLAYLDVTRSAPLRMPLSDRLRLSGALVRFLQNREAAQVAWKPKTHLMIHFIPDSVKFGNPRLNGTWLDESLNMKLAAVAASAHSAVWSLRIMACFGHEAGPTAMAVKALKRARLSE